ncbi:MAG: filamentous hemagglutinin N-terminal domain-containing protein [Negativicutes bacterium]
MKQSRKIRRNWLRYVPEWMKCFARTIIKVAKVQSRKAVKGLNCFHTNLKSQISKFGDGIRLHTKEWVAAALAAGLVAAPYAATAAPQGGAVVGGQATITQAGDVTNIAQTSQRAAIDWTSFDIAKHETVNFQQPNASAVALNRILGNNPSAIYGQLNANGIVYLANPNGIYFAPGAQVNVAGLIATTSHVDPLAFLQNGTINTSERNGAINMQGSIFASGGLVEIKGATAINIGGIIKATALNGNGGAITLNNIDNITVSGTISASADATGDGGKIIVFADNTADVSGAKLYARGGSASGDGGFVETSGKKVLFSGSIIQAGAINGKVGTWLIDPTGNYTLATSDINAFNASLTTQDVSFQVTNGSLTMLGDQTITYTGVSTRSLSLVATGAGSAIEMLSNATIDASASPLNITLTAGGGVTIGKINASSGSLTVSVGGAVSQSGALTAGTATINAGTNAITLTTATNDFTTFAATGGAISVTDTNGVILGTTRAYGTYSLTAGGTVTQSGLLHFDSATTISTSGSGAGIDLSTIANDFGVGAIYSFSGGAGAHNAKIYSTNSTAFSISTLGSGSLGNLTIINPNSGITLGGTNMTNMATLNATAGGSISQISGSALTVSGLSTITAGTNIDFLTNAGNNDFDTIAVTSANLSIKDANALMFGISSISGNTTINVGGALTQSGVITANGSGKTFTVSAGANNITLNSYSNDFATASLTGAIVSVKDANTLSIGASTISGNATFTSGAVAFTGATTINGDTIVVASGAVTQTAVITANGSGKTFTVSAGANNVTLETATNDFTTFAAAGGAISVADTNDIILGTTTATGTYRVNAGGTVTQSGLLSATGLATISTSGVAKTIDLSTSANSLSGGATYNFSQTGAHNALIRNTVNGAGFAIGTLSGSLVNLALNFNTATAITLGGTNLSEITGDLSLTGGAVAFGATTIGGNAIIAANGTVTQTDAIIANGSGKTFSVVPSSAGNNVVLDNVNNDFNIFGASPSAAVSFNTTVVDKNSLILSATNLGGGTLTATAGAAGSGSITQNGSLNLGAGVFTAATDIDLSASENVVSGVATYNYSATGAHTAAYKGWGTLVKSPTFGTVSGSLQNVTLYSDYSSGTLELANITAANLTATSNGAITQAAGASLVVTSATTVRANNGSNYYDITLGNSGNNFNSFGATGNAITVVDSNAIVLGNITNYNLGTGTLSVAAGGNITQTSGTALNLGKGDFSPTFTFVAKNGATYYDITLTNAGVSLTSANSFTGILAVTGKDVNITHTPRLAEQFGETLSLGDSVATGNYTLTTNCGGGAKAMWQQSGTITVGGTATFKAPGTIMMNTASNDFSILNISASTATIQDLNGITLGNIGWSGSSMSDFTLTAGGAIAQLTSTTIKVLNAAVSAQGGLSDISLNQSGNVFGQITTGSADVGGFEFTGNNVTIAGSNIVLGKTGASGASMSTANGAVTVTAYGSGDHTYGNIHQAIGAGITKNNAYAANFTGHSEVLVESRGANYSAIGLNDFGSGAVNLNVDLNYQVTQPSVLFENINTAAAMPMTKRGDIVYGVGSQILLPNRTATVSLPSFGDGNQTMSLTTNGAITQDPGAVWSAWSLTLRPKADTDLGSSGNQLNVRSHTLDLVAQNMFVNNAAISGATVDVALVASGNVEITSDSSIGSENTSMVDMSAGVGKHATFTVTGSGSSIWITNELSNFETAAVIYDFTGGGTHDIGYTNITDAEAAAPTLDVTGTMGQMYINMPNSPGTYLIGNVGNAALSLNFSNRDISQSDGTAITSNTVSITGRDITLTNDNNVFSGGAMTLSGRAISVKASTGDITLGTVNASGNLTVNAVSGSIVKTGDAVTTMLSNSAISMTASGNIAIGSYNSPLGTGSVSAVFTGTGEHDFYYGNSTLDAQLPSFTLVPLVKLHDLEIHLPGAFNHTSNYTLGSYDVTNNFSFTAPFDITQSAAITASGNVNILSNWGSVILTNTGNSLATQADATISLQGQRNVTLTGYVGDLNLNTVSAGYYGNGERIDGNLTLGATGNIIHSATAPGTRGMFVYGNAVINAGGNVDLEYTATGSIDTGLYFKNLVFTGTDVTVLSSAYIAASDTPLNGVEMGASTATGALALSTDGNVTQTGVLTKNNASGMTLTTTTSDSTIDLGGYSNNFGGGAVVFNLVSGSTENIVSFKNISSSAVMPTISGGSATTETVNLANAAVDLSGIIGSNLNLTAGAGITQTGGAITLASGRTLLLSANGNAITLNNVANDFASGELQLTGNIVSVKSGNNFTLGQSSISGSSLIWTTGGDISQTGAISTPTGSALTLKTEKSNGLIDVGTADNIFDGAVNFVYLGSGELTLGYKNISAINHAAPTVTAENGSFKNLVYDFVSGATLGDINIAANGSLTLNAGGAITQVAGKHINMGTGATTYINASGQTINFGNSGNTFSIIDIITAGAVTINNGTNPLTFTNTNTSSLGFTAGSTTVTGGAMTFAASNVTGTLDITATGAISGGGLTVSGASTIAAGSNNVTLATANNFGGAVVVSGNAVTLNNGTHNLTISSGGSYASIGMTGGDVTLTSTAGTLDFTAVSASGNLNVTTSGSITQTGAMTANGSGKTATFNAGSGDVTLTGSGNSFAMLSMSGANGQVSAGGFTLGATTLSNMTLASNGTVVQANSAALNVSGTTTLNAGTSGNVSMLNSTNVLGVVCASGNSVSVWNSGDTIIGASAFNNTLTVLSGGKITQSGAIIATGGLLSLTSNGDTTLDGNNDIGTFAANGGNIVFNDINSFAVDSSGIGASGNLTLLAGDSISQAAAPTAGITVQYGTLTLSGGTAGTINLAGGAVLTNENKYLSKSLNMIARLAVITGGRVAVATNSNIVLGAINIAGQNSATALRIIAHGNISQDGAMIITESSAFSELNSMDASNSIILNAANDIVGGMVLNSNGTGVHSVSFTNLSQWPSLMSLWVSTSSATGMVSLNANVPDRGLATSFSGINQPGSCAKFSNIVITCGGDLTQVDPTNSAWNYPWYVDDSATGDPKIALNVGGIVYLNGSIHNRFNKVLIVNGGTQYNIKTELPANEKLNKVTNGENEIVNMNT